jgi:GDP-D-mannose dehydratase
MPRALITSITGQDGRYLADLLVDKGHGNRPVSVPWKPEGPVNVLASPVLTGQTLITVEAPDRVGLLWAAVS